MLEEMWNQFRKRKLGLCALIFLSIFFLIGLYAPFFASSQPLAVVYEGKFYFPLFRYLFYPGFYTKPIDLFYNVLMFTFPLAVLGALFLKRKWRPVFFISLGCLHLSFYFFILMGGWKDPSKMGSVKKSEAWASELKEMNSYARLKLLLRYKQRKEQDDLLSPYVKAYESDRKKKVKTLFASDEDRYFEEKEALKVSLEIAKKISDQALQELPELMQSYPPFQHQVILAKFDLEQKEQAFKENSEDVEARKAFETALLTYQGKERAERERGGLIAQLQQKIQESRELFAKTSYITDKKEWEVTESQKVKVLVAPLIRRHHWEDDAGGGQGLNKYLPWWELTRINRKDLAAALLFGIRISLVVGITTVALALLLGVPMGLVSGYFAGKVDIVICRLIEIWEAMPAFFMLLLIVAIVQSKSLFLVIFILAIFGWTHFTRYIRGEVLRQRNLPYVMAARALGFRHRRIMLSHVLPNAIPPVLTLLPFSMMAAITAEAGLSFLGLGEEGSSSWGVLMAEGRSVFPGESYLLWPPAVLLTLLLVSIALVGDTLRDALDPKMRS